MWYALRMTRVALFTILLAAAAVAACGGSPSSPTPAAPVAAGSWSGDYTQGSCADNGATGFCASFLASTPVGSVQALRLMLSESGQQVSGSLSIGSVTIPVSGTFNASGQLSLTGATTVTISNVPTTIRLYAWNTLVSGRSMTGTFGLSYTFNSPGVAGVPATEQTLRTLTRLS
jgi:hypothetical protein